MLAIATKFRISNSIRHVTPLQHRKSICQSPPSLENPYKADMFLRLLLEQHLPSHVKEPILKDLKQFGKRITDEIDQLGLQAELEPPVLTQVSPWGERIDEVRTCLAWKRLKSISAEEGLVSLAYERAHGEYSRIHQAAKLHLFAPSSGLYNCPLAMTDGAAKLIQAENIASLLDTAFRFLTSRNPAQFWTSGQWMTERMGGSDVSRGTETVAVQQTDESYRLYGQKWFTSAVDSEMAFTLARVQQPDNSTDDQLSLFFLKTRQDDGSLNSMQIDKLKNKLGTRQLPTAELTLAGSRAQLIGRPKKGVRQISHMLTITRLHNSLAATGAMQRIVQLACDFAKKRETFGKPLFKHPLHVRTLAVMKIRTMKATAFAMDVSRLLGLIEAGNTSENNTVLLRVLTPLLKLYTAKEAVSVISEGLECFGGQGYIEDTGLPRLLRDAQVLPIWEGTTNILCLDLLRVHASTGGLWYRVFIDLIKQRIRGASAVGVELTLIAEKLSADITELDMILDALFSDDILFETALRDIAFSLCNIYISSLFLEYASSKSANRIMTYMAEQCSNYKNVCIAGVREYGQLARKSHLQLCYLKGPI